MTLRFSLSDRNLILTGYIGPNQRHVARQVAEQLRVPFVDVEREIANRVNLPIDDLRSSFGETHLKAIESEIVHELALRRSAVIRISGRTLARSDHLARLRATGPVICLVIELGVMLRRLHVNMGARYHDPEERDLVLAELKR